MLKFCLLGSGSGGNAVLVRAGDTKILIDNGLSLRQLEARAALVGETIENVSAVFVTHEHSDHVAGLGVLTRRYATPVYMTAGTRENLPESLGALKTVQTFESGATVRLGSLSISSFNVPHDAADPVSFVIRANGVKLGLIGDLGKPSPVVHDRLAGSHALILESNYCPAMLKDSSYPAAIRQRIGGTHGHLSNAEASKLLAHLMHDALKLVVLTHISQENNTPEEALRIVSSVVKNGQTQIRVAHQDRPTEMFEIAV